MPISFIQTTILSVIVQLHRWQLEWLGSSLASKPLQVPISMVHNYVFTFTSDIDLVTKGDGGSMIKPFFKNSIFHHYVMFAMHWFSICVHRKYWMFLTDEFSHVYGGYIPFFRRKDPVPTPFTVNISVNQIQSEAACYSLFKFPT